MSTRSRDFDQFLKESIAMIECLCVYFAQRPDYIVDKLTLPGNNPCGYVIHRLEQLFYSAAQVEDVWLSWVQRDLMASLAVASSVYPTVELTLGNLDKIRLMNDVARRRTELAEKLG